MTSQAKPASKQAAEAAAKYDHGALWQLAKGTKKWPKNSVRVYSSAIREWVTFCEEHDYDLLAPPHEADQEFMDQLLFVNGLKPQTAKLRYSVARFLYRAFAEWGLVNRPFADPLRYDKPDRKDTYTKSELTKLLAAGDWQERLLIWWHVETGQRLHLLLKLTWDDLEDMRLAKTQGHQIVLGDRVRQALADAPKRDSHIMSFRTQQRCNQRFRDLCEDVGVEYKGVDVMRYYSGAVPDA